MKLVLIAAVSLLAGCKDKPREASQPPPAPGSSAPASTAPSPTPAPGSAAPGAPTPAAEGPTPDACRMAIDVLGLSTCKTAEALQSLASAKKSVDGVIETIGKVGNTNTRQFQVVCAQMLLAIEQDAAKLGCTIAFDPARRAQINGLLEAWYGQRTPVAPTGDAAADAVIAKIAAVRDAACACKDAACLEGLQKQLGGVGEMPRTAPDAARLLGSKLLEDAGRCASRIRTKGAPPP